MKKIILVIVALFAVNFTVFANTTIDPVKGKKKSKTEKAEKETIKVRVVDASGGVVLEKEVALTEFLETKHNIADLPEGSLFLLLRGNVAYFMLDEQPEN